MSLVAPVEDGKVVETSSQSSLEKAQKNLPMAWIRMPSCSFWWRR